MLDDKTWLAFGVSVHSNTVQEGRGQDSLQDSQVLPSPVSLGITFILDDYVCNALRLMPAQEVMHLLCSKGESGK